MKRLQQVALRGIQAVREAGHDKGLAVSATGTGKTYLSAFDVRSFAPKGKATPDQNAVEQSTMQDKNDKTIPLVHMNLMLEHSVESKLFYYIGSEEN